MAVSGYSFINSGRCLGSVIPDGTLLETDPDAAIAVGDIVAIVVRGDGPFSGLGSRLSGDGLLGLTKIFLGGETHAAGGTVLLFGQLNPPIIAPIPESALEAMHLVVGGSYGAPNDETMTANDAAALDVIGPYFRQWPQQPAINSAWRPNQEKAA